MFSIMAFETAGLLRSMKSDNPFTVLSPGCNKFRHVSGFMNVIDGKDLHSSHQHIMIIKGKGHQGLTSTGNLLAPKHIYTVPKQKAVIFHLSDHHLIILMFPSTQ